MIADQKPMLTSPSGGLIREPVANSFAEYSAQASVLPVLTHYALPNTIPTRPPRVVSNKR
jgi:hypothetical protein